MQLKPWFIFWVAFSAVFITSCKKSSDGIDAGSMQLIRTKAGSTYLDVQTAKKDIPVNGTIEIEFNTPLDTVSARLGVQLKKSGGETVSCTIRFSADYKTIIITPNQSLPYVSDFILQISEKLKGKAGETFPGVSYTFTTENGVMFVEAATINGQNFIPPLTAKDINTKQLQIELSFSQPLNTSNYKNYFSVSNGAAVSMALSTDYKKVTITGTSNLTGWQRYYVNVSSDLTAANGFTFGGFSNSFFTANDSTMKFPQLTDNELLDLIQKQTLRYFYDYAHPVSGLARERLGSGDVVTIGGSGFGIMALLVGIERNFITRQQGFDQINKMVNFLNNPATSKFHGAFPHWMNGSTGKVIPFGTKDDGADLVETAYLFEGLLAAKEYFKSGTTVEKNLCDTIQKLWERVEWSWFRQGNQNKLYWHWSPNYGWDMNMPIAGWNEALIVYVLAASSPSYSIPKAVYDEGWARNGAFPMKNGKSFYNIQLPLGEDYGGPLFFEHYTFLGLDPRNLSDSYATYWQQTVNHSRINWAYCVANPKNYIGYSKDIWGLTASDNPWGYNAHSPTNDLGVISPTAAISSIAYTPQESMRAIRFFYYYMGDKLWGNYGFYDAFDIGEGWFASSYLAIDQGPIICMIENYRSALLWNLFMANQDVKNGLNKLGFTY